MAVEREDTESPRGGSGTEPGLGRDDARGDSRGYVKKAAGPADTVEEPAAVDFDALHAALGDPLDYQEMPAPAHEKGVTGESDDLLDGLEANLAAGRAASTQLISESSGQLSATYSSARPRTIPPTRAPNEDLNAPAVIVASDDTVPSAPPQMTVPFAQPQGRGAGPGRPLGPPSGPRMGQAPPHPNHSGPPSAPGSAPGAHGMVPGHAGAGSHPNTPAAASYGQTPVPFPPTGRGAIQMTARMPERPINPRRGKTPTIVVWPRGPSTKQKLVAFMAMLLLVTACGIAVIIWRQPSWLGLDSLSSPPATTSALAAPLGTPVAPLPTADEPAALPAPAPDPAPDPSGATSAAPASSAESRPAPTAHALPAPTGAPPPVRKAAKPPAVHAPAPHAPAPRAPAPRAPAPRRADPNTL